MSSRDSLGPSADLERLATVRQKRGRRTSERERVRGGGKERESQRR